MKNNVMDFKTGKPLQPTVKQDDPKILNDADGCLNNTFETQNYTNKTGTNQDEESDNISISESDSQNGIQYNHKLIGTFNPDLGIVNKQENDEIYIGGVLFKFPTNTQEYEILIKKITILFECLKDFIENRDTIITLEHIQMVHELLDLPKIISFQNDLERFKIILNNLIKLVAQIGDFVGYELPKPNGENKNQ